MKLCYNQDMDWAITGHKRQINFLENALTRGKLAHAYVFAGPAGVGKKLIAKKLAREILAQELGDFHPDFIEINSDGGIKIEQIRELIYKLSLHPYQAKNKVAVIDRADEMTVEAANALLKSLEEPKSFTYIFLITTNPNKLPKTVSSRCQKITFGPLPSATDSSEEATRASEFYKVFRSEELVDKLIAAYEIADLETVEIKQLLDYWLKSLQTELQADATKSLARKIVQVSASRRFLEQNVNSKLLLTNLMLNA